MAYLHQVVRAVTHRIRVALPACRWAYVATVIVMIPCVGHTATTTEDLCSGLVGLSLGAARVTAAEVVPALEVISKRQITKPFCRVHGIATPSSDSVINFEVWLPVAADWSGRLKVDGTGGYAGAIPVWAMVKDLAGGFAAAGSDMGHTGGKSVDWTIGHPEKVKDWGYRAHYVVTMAAKALTSAYYSRPATHTYYEGCSNGGRQGMMMAERYPELFDGIIAGAPSMYYPDMVLSVLWTGYNLTPVRDQAQSIPAAKLTMVAARALAACDGQDGLVDHYLANPAACQFDPASLKCPGADAADCLTEAELRVMQAIYRGITSPDGAQRWNGPAIGSEAEWETRGNFPDAGGFNSFIAHFVYADTTGHFDGRKLNLSAEYDRIKTALAPWLEASSVDLTRFRAHGGKLIQYQGWEDSVVVPQSTINYAHALAVFESLAGLSVTDFNLAVAKLTPAEVIAADHASASRLANYYRLFMLPGVEHCNGGPGPSTIEGRSDHLLRAPLTQPNPKQPDGDIVLALVRWVEQGVAPAAIIATKVTSQVVAGQRPLCVNPAEARYNGSGDVNSAASFTCVEPKADAAVTSTDVRQIQHSLHQSALTHYGIPVADATIRTAAIQP